MDNKDFNCSAIVISVLVGIFTAILGFCCLLEGFSIAVWVGLAIALFVLLVLQMANTGCARQCRILDRCLIKYGKKMLISALALVVLSVLFIALGCYALCFWVMLAFIFVNTSVFVYMLIAFMGFMTCLAKCKTDC